MYPRFAERRIEEALEDTRVVLVCGPRQSGKTTLTQQIAGDAIPFITLDYATALEAASTDPVGFLCGIDRAVSDEVQRAPGQPPATKATERALRGIVLDRKSWLFAGSDRDGRRETGVPTAPPHSTCGGKNSSSHQLP